MTDNTLETFQGISFPAEKLELQVKSLRIYQCSLIRFGFYKHTLINELDSDWKLKVLQSKGLVYECIYWGLNLKRLMGPELHPYPK